jgi:hypothetical protein
MRVGYMDWIDVAQSRERWWALVNVVINLRVAKKGGDLLNGWEAVSFTWS